MKFPLFSRAKTQTAGLEDTLTPLEIAALLQQPKNRDLPFAVASLLKRQPPVAYRRQNLSKGVSFSPRIAGHESLSWVFVDAGVA